MLYEKDGRLVRQFDHETLWIEPWGHNGLRVRATRRQQMEAFDWALLPHDGSQARIEVQADAGTITHGELTAQVSDEGWLRFTNGAGTVLLEERWRNRA